MSIFNTMIRISCISFVAIIAILKNFIPLNAISDTEFLAVTIATHENDALMRYKQSAESFKIPYEIFGMGQQWKGGDIKVSPGGGQKVRIMRESLAKYKDNRNMIIMFTDSYDVVFQNNTEAILEKFFNSKSRVLFSAEGFCWPDKSLAKNYPKVGEFEKRFLNSGGYIGYASDLYELANLYPIENTDDDQLYYTKIFLIESERNKFQMKLDTKSEIFQNLNGALDEMYLNHQESTGYLKNVISKSMPVVIHANGPVKNVFNGWTNYIGYSWHPAKGCQHCNNSKVDLTSRKNSEYPSITVALIVDRPTPFIDEYFERVGKLSYPSSRINVLVYCSNKHHEQACRNFTTNNKSQFKSIKMIDESFNNSESTLRNNVIDTAINMDNDFLFIVDSIVQLTNPNTLSELVELNKSVIAPMLLRRGKLWSNFWGSLNNDGFYARSDDYLDIAQYTKQGIWNVPFINSAYLINKSVLKEFTKAYTADISPDMAFCELARDKNIFLWVDNRDEYGHQVVAEEHPTSHLHNDLWEIFTNPLDWQEKYIHPKYWEVSAEDKEMKTVNQPCPDVFWFPLVSEKFCKQMIEEMENYGQWSDGGNKDSRLEGGYENVPTRDIHMRQVDWEPHWQHVLRTYIYPMQKKVFNGYDDMPGARMNFVVRYRPDEQPTLRPHQDASSYSLNIALNLPGIDFEGGGTRFNRYNCEVKQSRLGWVLMHPGRITHLHEGLRTTNGTRYIFVTFVNP